MSIKIYNGLRAMKSDPFEVGMDVRKVLEPIFFNKFNNILEMYLELSKSGIQANWNYYNEFFNTPEDSKPIPEHSAFIQREIYNKIEKLNRQVTHTFSDADICYHVSILPNACKGDNPLMMVMGENNVEYTEALLEAGVVEAFGYWDNSDPEDDVTDEEWEYRKKSWSYLLDDVAPVNLELGITYPSSFDVSMWRIDKVNEDKQKTKEKDEK